MWISPTCLTALVLYRQKGWFAVIHPAKQTLAFSFPPGMLFAFCSLSLVSGHLLSPIFSAFPLQHSISPFYSITLLFNPCMLPLMASPQMLSRSLCLSEGHKAFWPRFMLRCSPSKQLLPVNITKYTQRVYYPSLKEAVGPLNMIYVLQSRPNRHGWTQYP